MCNPKISYELLRALDLLKDGSISRIVICGDPAKIFAKPIAIMSTIHKSQGKTIHDLLGYNNKEMG